MTDGDIGDDLALRPLDVDARLYLGDVARQQERLQVVSDAEYRAWEAEASALATRSYDPEDKGAHWGWRWNQRAGKAKP